MRAPRAAAAPASSRTTSAAPSPRAKPARRAPNGTGAPSPSELSRPVRQKPTKRLLAELVGAAGEQDLGAPAADQPGGVGEGLEAGLGAAGEVEFTPRRSCQIAVCPAAALITVLAKSSGLT